MSLDPDTIAHDIGAARIVAVETEATIIHLTGEGGDGPVLEVSIRRGVLPPILGMMFCVPEVSRVRAEIRARWEAGHDGPIDFLTVA